MIERFTSEDVGKQVCLDLDLTKLEKRNSSDNPDTQRFPYDAVLSSYFVRKVDPISIGQKLGASLIRITGTLEDDVRKVDPIYLGQKLGASLIRITGTLEDVGDDYVELSG